MKRTFSTVFTSLSHPFNYLKSTHYTVLLAWETGYTDPGAASVGSTAHTPAPEACVSGPNRVAFIPESCVCKLSGLLPGQNQVTLTREHITPEWINMPFARSKHLPI